MYVRYVPVLYSMFSAHLPMIICLFYLSKHICLCSSKKKKIILINRNSKWGALVRSETSSLQKNPVFRDKKRSLHKKTHKKYIFSKPKNSVFLKTRNFGTRQSALFRFFFWRRLCLTVCFRKITSPRGHPRRLSSLELRIRIGISAVCMVKGGTQGGIDLLIGSRGPP